MQDRIFYSSCFGFIFGVFFRSFLPAQVGIFVNFYFTLFLAFLAVALIFYFSLVKFKWGIIAGIFVLAFALGILRFHMVDHPAPEVFESVVFEKVELTGEIIDEPDIRENNQKLTILVAPQGLAFMDAKAKTFPTTKILVTTGLEEDFTYGDEINISGKLEKPENFMTDQGKEFDYISYLKKDGIFYLMSYPKIKIVSTGNGNKIQSILFLVKEKFLSKVNFAIRSPENLLMGGLILGEKSAFSGELRQSFVDTGTIHIVALSGYNVTIVAEWFMKFLRFWKFLPQSSAFSIGIILVWLFVLMTGGGSTAIRAGIMATLALVARATGRSYDVARALVLAGVIMIFINPYVLVYDVSFQLSFIATIAVIFLAPRIEKYFMRVTDKFELRDIVSVTCSAYIFVLPFIIYKMGNLSLVALPANVLILPFIPVTMFLGFLTGFLGLFWYVLSVPFGYVSFLFLHYELGVISFLSHLPFASITFPNFPLILTLLIYIYFMYRLFGRSMYKFFTEEF